MSGLNEEDPFHEGVVWAIDRILDQINGIEIGGDKSIHEALVRRDKRVRDAAYKSGADDGYSRSQSRPGWGDMGG